MKLLSLKRRLKEVKGFYGSLRDYIFSLRLGKRVLKGIKRLVKFVLSIRVGIRPEFISGIKNFELRIRKGKSTWDYGRLKDVKGIYRNLREYMRRLLRFTWFGVIHHRRNDPTTLALRGASKKRIGKVVGLVLPILIAVLILKYVSPISAQLTGYEERLNSYLADNNVTAGTEKNAELIDQVYYTFENVKNFVTDSKNAKGGVATKNEDITWMESVDGNWQIFLYNIPTKIRTQLTYAGNNVNPKVDGGNVVWEGIRTGSDWQVYLYDGLSLGPISTGDPSFKPDISGNFVVYSRKDVNDQWRSTAYSINDRENVDIDFGEDNKYVSLKDKDLFIGFEGKAKKFSLNVEDLMILRLGALSSKSSASIEAIQKEIDGLTGGSTPEGTGL